MSSSWLTNYCIVLVLQILQISAQIKEDNTTLPPVNGSKDPPILSTGEVIGIVIGSAIGIVAICVPLYYGYHSKKRADEEAKKKREKKSDSLDVTINIDTTDLGEPSSDNSNDKRQETTQLLEDMSSSTSQNTGDSPGDISNSDIIDIIKQLGNTELQNLYIRLRISPKEIDEAKGDRDRVDVNERAIRVFRYWRTTFGINANRKAIFDGLERCVNRKAYEQLENELKWSNEDMAQADDVDCLDVIDILGSDDLTNLFLNLPPDPLSCQDIKKAENDRSDNVNLAASAILSFWRQKNSGNAGRKVILAALVKCKNIDAKEKLEKKWKQSD